MRISDWSSDVCSSDLSIPARPSAVPRARAVAAARAPDRPRSPRAVPAIGGVAHVPHALRDAQRATPSLVRVRVPPRSEEHTSELQSLMRISYAVFCLKKKKKKHKNTNMY